MVRHSLYIALTGQFDAIVRLSWLQKMALSIDWAWGLLMLQNCKGNPCATTASVASAGSGIPPKYADYAGLFNKKTADVLPAHQKWNHCIPLEKGKPPLYEPIYELIPIEVKVLRKEMDKNLKQGFI